MPSGLIPLMLSPGLRSSFGSGSRPSSSVSPAPHASSPPATTASFQMNANAHKRSASETTPPSILLSRPPKTMKRQSQQVPASLPVLPYTPAEWRRAIADIKRLHVTRRYRACSARCMEILSNIKNTSMVEPAYLIYLNFYAATSLEACAHPLPATSTYRTSLLQQARGLYDGASSLIRAAEESATDRCSSAASSAPSLRSPSSSSSSSGSSRACSPDAGSIGTPASSTLSRESSLSSRRGGEEGGVEEKEKKEKQELRAASSRRQPSSQPQQQPQQQQPPQKKPKKKVSFELPKDDKSSGGAGPGDRDRRSIRLPEPLVRPDSPTLGFDDDYFAAGVQRQELPELPAKRPVSRQDFYDEVPVPVPMPMFTPLPERTSSPSMSPPMPPIREESAPTSPAMPPNTADGGGEAEGGAEAEAEERSSRLDDAALLRSSSTTPTPDAELLSSRSLARYCATLSSLKAQVAAHVCSLDSALETQQQAGSRPSSPFEAATLRRLSMSSAGAGGYGGGGYKDYPYYRSASSLSYASSTSSFRGFGDDEEARRARIDRLRMAGWKRKRFDARRYEELCDAVLAELN